RESTRIVISDETAATARRMPASSVWRGQWLAETAMVPPTAARMTAHSRPRVRICQMSLAASHLRMRAEAGNFHYLRDQATDHASAPYFATRSSGTELGISGPR